MKVSDLEALGYTRETKKEMEDFEIKAGYTGDLLSDVMANAPLKSIEKRLNVVILNTDIPDSSSYRSMLPEKARKGMRRTSSGRLTLWNRFQFSCLF